MKCYNCYSPHLDEKAEACEHCGALTNPPATKYLYVHPLRFLLRSVITFGLFSIYWYYENWEAIKEAEKTKIHPLWRAVFHQYFFVNLFTRIYGDAKAYGYKSRFSANNIIIFYIIATNLLSFEKGMFTHIDQHVLLKASNIAIIGILGLIAVLPPLLIQPAIKFYNAHVAADHAEKRELTPKA